MGKTKARTVRNRRSSAPLLTTKGKNMRKFWQKRPTQRKEQPRRPDGAYATERVSTALKMAREMGNDKLVKRLEALL